MFEVNLVMFTLHAKVAQIQLFWLKCDSGVFFHVSVNTSNHMEHIFLVPTLVLNQINQIMSAARVL